METSCLGQRQQRLYGLVIIPIQKYWIMSDQSELSILKSYQIRFLLFIMGQTVQDELQGKVKY